jgi:7-carboxy-7-deazaguanine synthase
VLTVSEIYVSVQGESTYTGRPCTFVRLAACNLRCSWCDTPYAFTGGTKMMVDEVVAEVARRGVPLVEVTGGEPLLQAAVIPLMERLLGSGHEVLLETGGHLPLDDVPDEVRVIVDVKCPGSGESGAMHWPNLDQLSRQDEVKFVVGDRVDFDYAWDVIVRHNLAERAGAILLSPVFGVLEPARLAEWILAELGCRPAEAAAVSRVVRLHLQSHKYVWDPATRGV